MDDDLMVAGTPTGLVKAASTVLALAGVFIALTGVQVLGARFFEAWVNAVPPLFLVMGIALVPAALSLFRGSMFAAVAAVAIAGLAFLMTSAWFIFTFGSILSLMNVMAVPMAGLGALLGLLALPHVRKMAQAKQRLAEQGMSLGL